MEIDRDIEPARGGTNTLRYSYFNIGQYETQGATLRPAFLLAGFCLDLGGKVTGFYNPYSAEFPSTPKFTYTYEFNGGHHGRFGRTAATERKPLARAGVFG